MVEWIRNLVVPEFEDEELNRRAFNLNVILLSTFVIMLLGIVAMLFQLGTRPLSYVLPNTLFIAMAAGILMVCYALSQRGRVSAGSIIFVAMMTLACTGAVVVGGTQGALPVILIIPVAAAGTTLGGNAGLVMAVFNVGVLIAVGILERNGVIQVSYPPSETTIVLNMFDVGFSLFFATLSIWLSSYSLRISLERTQEAVVEADQYREELERTLAAEEMTRSRLEQAINEYAAFLDRIGRGDYDARLSLDVADENLRVLQRQLNTTVDTLVETLEASEAARREVERAQRRYLVQTWRDYVRRARTTEFELTEGVEKTSQGQLLPALKSAVTEKQPVALKAGEDDGSPTTLAAPIKLRDEVIGVLGISRGEDDTPWTEEERALVAAVVERLAMTAESLRLMDETQRRAAREQTIAEVGSRIRASLDMETMLQSAASEMREALGLDDLVIRLTDPDSAEDRNRERE
jgi:hypothetical protein